MLKVMIFKIYRNFLEFFWIYLRVFSILKVFKSIKKGKNGLFIAQDLHGCDVARKATWQSHMDPRECLRGKEVMCTYYIYCTYGYSTYKHSIEELANHYNWSTLYTRDLSFIFFVCDYVSFFSFDCRTRGKAWSVGFKSCGWSRVDAVDFRSTRSMIAHVLQSGLKWINLNRWSHEL